MSYYGAMGDYYRGDYYRGDPFLGGIMAKVGAKFASPLLKKVVPAAARLIFGSKPLTRGSQIITRPLARAVGAAGTVATGVSLVKAARGMGGGGMPAPIEGFAPSERGFAAAAMNGGCPSGFHPCKSPDGCKGGPCVRNRRMNPANPKALRRGLRRISGFAKLASRSRRDIGRAATAAGVRRSAGKKRR